LLTTLNKEAVERKHGGSATLARSVPICETFEGQVVWEGVMHVCDLAGHPTAARAYAIGEDQAEGSTNGVSLPGGHYRRDP
jgi:hypothetical protein